MPSPRARSQRPATDVSRAQRIYVNRSLRLDKIEAIGFDMDHTLAAYRPLPFERLAFDQAKRKLVAAGYPRAVARLRYDQTFVIRGLIVDRRRGNILKMDRHHYVVQAYHGTRKLPSEMRKSLYAHRRLRVTGTTFVPVDTLFSIPEISLYAQLVDLLDSRERHVKYRELYDDVRGAIDAAHADGSIKSIVMRAPRRHLEVDRALPQTLDRMASRGLRLFLLTNSEPEYTHAVMEQLLAGRIEARPAWSDFFDLVVARAGKPGFFGGHDDLHRLDPRILGASGGRRRFAFRGGSVGALERELGVVGDAILYFGDHTYGDILRSKRLCGWRTAMIVRRLESEIEALRAARPHWRRLERLERRSDRLAADCDFLERALDGKVSAGELRRFLRARGMRGGPSRVPEHLAASVAEWKQTIAAVEAIESEVDQLFNPYWGSMFRAGRLASHFGNQLEEFACIYTSRVSNFLNYPLDKYFVTAHDFLPHER